MLSSKPLSRSWPAALLLLASLSIFSAAWLNGFSASAQPNTIPLGTYTAVLNDPPSNPLFTVGQYQLTLLEGGKFRYQMNDKVIATGTYTLNTDRVEFTLPAGVGACASKGIYQLSLQGNKLSLALPAGQTDGCGQRTGMALTYYRTDQLESLWRKLGPSGGGVYSLLVSGGKLFAGTDEGGIFVSTDFGQSWRQTRSPRAFSVRALAEFNGNLFAAAKYSNFIETASGSVLLISTDGGENWEFIPNLPIASTSNFEITDFAIFNGKLCAGVVGQGVLRITDNPYVWEKLGTTGLTSLNVSSLAVIGVNLFVGTVGGGVFISQDGNTWTAASNGLTYLGIFTLATNGNTLYAGSFGGAAQNEVFMTQNNGQNWTRVGNGLATLPESPNTNVYKLALVGGKLLAASDAGVIANEGGNWRTAFRGPFVWSVRSLAALGNQVFTGHFFDGFSRSLDGGTTWDFANTGLTARVTTAVFKDNGVLYAGVEDGILTSVNDGQTWTRSSLPGQAPRNFLAFDGKVFVGTHPGVGGNSGVYVTSNQGQTWTRVLATGTVARVAVVGDVLYATATGTGVLRSMDRGQTWTGVGVGLNPVSLTVRGTTLFVGTRSAGVYRSTDGGDNWTAVNNGLPSGDVFSMVTSGNYVLAAFNGQGIYRSSDNGETWVKTANGANHPYVIRMYATGNTVFAGGLKGLGVIRSSDNGQTWDYVNAGFDTRYVYDFFVSGSTLYAATSNGIYSSNALVNPLANVSAASYSPAAIAEKSIVAMYGVNLATNVASAGTVPLPTSLLGTSVKIRDSNGVERLAPLFFVSAGQVNYQIPAGTAPGTAIVSTVNGDGVGAISSLEVRAIAPSVFTANASGSGAAAALDAIKYTPAPFDPKLPNGDPNVIAVFGTGLGADATDIAGDVKADVTARLDGNVVTLLYAGQAPGLVGANQFNVVLPANITSGVHTLTFTRGGVTSNTTTLAIR